MLIPEGYTLEKEEVLGQCNGCDLLSKDNFCFHPKGEMGPFAIGCKIQKKIFKKKNLRSKIAEILNKMGIDNEYGIPDYVLADHMVDSIETLLKSKKAMLLH